jgi:hypothetical protein
MKKRKNLLLTGLIYIILLAAFNLLAFVIFKRHSNVFWISYAFMTLAFVVQIISMLLSFKKADVETVFFGIPLASLSVFYLTAELCVGAIFMIFQDIGATVPIVIQVLLLTAFAVIAIIALMARDTTQEIGDRIKEKIVTLKSAGTDIEMLLASCSDPELKSRLRKLSDTVRYSDPMSTDAVADTDRRIRQKASELRIYCENNEIEEAEKTCSAMELLYTERNKRLMDSK